MDVANSFRLVKRTCIVARLFYHTAMCLLPQMHPTIPADQPDMHELKMEHVHMICGIVAHVKDRYDYSTPSSTNNNSLVSGGSQV